MSMEISKDDKLPAFILKDGTRFECSKWALDAAKRIDFIALNCADTSDACWPTIQYAINAATAPKDTQIADLQTRVQELEAENKAVKDICLTLKRRISYIHHADNCSLRFTAKCDCGHAILLNYLQALEQKGGE